MLQSHHSAPSVWKHWTDYLLRILSYDRYPYSLQANAGSLLEVFAEEEDYPAVERLLVDTAKPGVSRAGALETLLCSDWSISSASVQRLVIEFSERLSAPQARHERPGKFLSSCAIHDGRSTASRLAEVIHLASRSGHDGVFDRLLATLPANVAEHTSSSLKRCQKSDDVDEQPHIYTGDFHKMPIEELLGIRFLEVVPDQRPFLEWALNSELPVIQHVALDSLIQLDSKFDEETLARFMASEHPMLRLTAMGVAARTGDASARAELERSALAAEHVVLRAQALRSLRYGAPNFEIFEYALKFDHEVYDLHYAPATEQAALGLAEHDDLDEHTCLEALVHARLNLHNCDAEWAIDHAVKSWNYEVELPPRGIGSWQYLWPPDRYDETQREMGPRSFP